MIFFKTRHEVRKLQRDVADLSEMLRAHFNIKYTLKDFERYYAEHESTDPIPTSVGEFLHYYDMISPKVRSVYFRGLEVEPTNNSKEEQE